MEFIGIIMRIWSIHPKYLDSKGLVALWRECLLAQAVLAGRTKGYMNHPQLQRFLEYSDPISLIGAYLAAVHHEALLRGYRFDFSKIEIPPGSGREGEAVRAVTLGQLEFEWAHFKAKLKIRNRAMYEAWKEVGTPDCHPIFFVVPGEAESWEKRKKEI